MPPSTPARHRTGTPGRVTVLRVGADPRRPQWLEVLAGDDPALRRPGTGEPRISIISAAAGLDRSHLNQLASGRIGVGLKAVNALVGFLEARGVDSVQADLSLFEHVTQEEADARRRVAV